MKLRLAVKATTRATRISGQDPPLDVSINLTVENAERGEPTVGAVTAALSEANKAVAKLLETRGY